MGLFNKVKEHYFTAKEMQYNRKLLMDDIAKLQEELYERKDETSHQIFCTFLQKLLNLEVLNLSESKDRSPDAYAFSRGKVEGLRHAINVRDEFIARERAVRSAKGKKTQAEALHKPYFRQPPMSVGMSD